MMFNLNHLVSPQMTGERMDALVQVQQADLIMVTDQKFADDVTYLSVVVIN